MVGQRPSRWGRSVVAAGIASWAACAVDAGRPPVARIELMPDQLIENDGFQTVITLDGRASADPIDHPDGVRLGFAWQIEGDEVRFEPGSRADQPAPAVRLRGDRPATIILTVTDDDGLSATTTARLRLTAAR